MLTKRIIPCLDVKDGVVVKGIKFLNHKKVGSIIDMAKKYSDEGADELVFYDISASTKDALVSKKWVEEIARNINIPFCVAGGINDVENARLILNSGADKVSVNSPLSDIGLDCDKDTLLVKALPLGPTCHTGTTSCFDDKFLCTDMIKNLEGIIDERAASTNTNSYIVSLFNKGVKEIAKKVNEEAGETAISAVSNDGRIIEEAADLVFHLLVLLRSQNKTMKDVTDKLYERSINQ